jgi:uncharacterized iron-regulated protein
MRVVLPCCVLLVLAATVARAADDDVLLLPIGDPERRERTVDVVLDAVTDCRNNEPLTPAQLAQRLQNVQLLFVGESHTDIDFHRTQLRVIRALHEAGRPVMIGLEMYPYTEQEFLDQWVGGLLTEKGFLKLSRWYHNWGYHWDYYREIFLYARQNAIPMYALNTPREVIKAVRKKGLEDLSEEEAARVPAQVDTDNDEHLRLFKVYFAGGDDQFHASMSDAQWRGMFAAQCTWDATMGHNSVRALQQHGGEDSIMVVLIGSGHVAYGLGIQRQAAQWFDGTMAALLPVPVADEDGEPVERAQASYADFIWGLPPVTDALYPGLGISTKKADESERRKVIHVPQDSIGARAGFQVGDVVLSMNGVEIPDKESFNRHMADLRWGDSALFGVLRGEEHVILTAHFRRQRPEQNEED